ncbi:hypothetical protein BHR79_03035 [Methanohalophilus halophilus]|uniref:Polysaccharide pyruvyl transferase domain-containing protein n=1 Tax=Methanohalophilus halophilus TaxID=2177 RepID=A0A1L3Q4P4_9EURY|nr:hypothetical protein BHR79_03035 [Methanohalophilus halophilus]
MKKIIPFINKKLCFKKYELNESRKGKEIPLSHVSVYSLGNIGDTILSKCVRSIFNECNNSLSWNLIPVKKTVNSNSIMQINESEMLVIGGGGLFLPDTNKNNISGWQWACGKDSLNQIKIPIVFFAVGYNYFKGQHPESLFVENLKEFVKKSSFFGVRNSGSRKKIIELVGTQFEEKIVFQPCPTTLISKLYSLPEKKRTKNIAFNVAFDRYDKRFGKNIYLILSQIASAAKRLDDLGYNIYLVNHIKKDATFSLSLDNASVPYVNVDLSGEFPDKAIEFYKQMDVVIGMRGHAQMIPFGLNCGIITLGSHDKMKWFLEDIDSLDFYIDITEEPEYLSDAIFNKFMCLYGDNYKFNNTIQRIKKKQDDLYNITLSNMHKILHLLKNQVD